LIESCSKKMVAQGGNKSNRSVKKVGAELSEYEQLRENNIRERQDMLAKLKSDFKVYKIDSGLIKTTPECDKTENGSRKAQPVPRKPAPAPVEVCVRKSARLSNLQKKVSYADMDNAAEDRRTTSVKRSSRSAPSSLYMRVLKNLDESELKLSNDMADACRTHCKLCDDAVKLVAMRNHTRKRHGMTITQYKAQFGVEYQIIEKIFHKCGICEKVIILCSDSVATHLKTPGHNMSHKLYNQKFMVTRANE